MSQEKLYKEITEYLDKSALEIADELAKSISNGDFIEIEKLSMKYDYNRMIRTDVEEIYEDLNEFTEETVSSDTATEEQDKRVYVRFVDEEAHEISPNRFPSCGTIGYTYTKNLAGDYALIQWPKGSTSMDDEWTCRTEQFEILFDYNPDTAKEDKQ